MFLFPFLLYIRLSETTELKQIKCFFCELDLWSVQEGSKFLTDLLTMHYWLLLWNSFLYISRNGYCLYGCVRQLNSSFLSYALLFNGPQICVSNSEINDVWILPPRVFVWVRVPPYKAFSLFGNEHTNKALTLFCANATHFLIRTLTRLPGSTWWILDARIKRLLPKISEHFWRFLENFQKSKNA